MQSFAESISEDQFKIDLERTLQRKKPFQNFKYAVETSRYRQVRFDFKQSELEKIIINQLESEAFKG
ncbi:hypothetical protein RLT85_03745 [Mesonia ostreae]|uniref:Uncharacterized protein n=1 Tax=Mesonia ostreae TaxID=861110 RepID=A0ABU2KGC1_9FLAO|nr:hypothetical protein [Mesonia ostreae]MDT0293736.1 hypothetical protein [Mesonia ostreae]